MITYRVDPAREYRTLSPVSGRHAEFGEVEIRWDGRVAALATSGGVALFNPSNGSRLAFLPIGGARPLFGASGDLFTSGTAGVWRWPVRLDPDLKRFRIGPPHRLGLPSGANRGFA